MLNDTYPLYLANKPLAPNADLTVTNKYTGETATRVALADEALIDRAIAATVDAATPCRKLPAYRRAADPSPRRVPYSSVRKQPEIRAAESAPSGILHIRKPPRKP